MHLEHVVGLFGCAEALVEPVELGLERLALGVFELPVHVLYRVVFASRVHVGYDGALLLVKDFGVLLSAVFERFVVVVLVLFDGVLELGCVGAVFLSFELFDVFSASDLFFVVIFERFFLKFFETTLFFFYSFSM